MIKINVKVDLSGMKKAFASAEKQATFATAKALTDTAKDAQAAVTAALPQVFDRPNPFTMRAVGITPANKQTLTAVVYLRQKQAEYLRLQVEGGTRHPRGRALLLPGDVRRDRYGNVPRATLRRLKARRDVFSGTLAGVAGMWQRKRKGAKLLFAYEPKAEYRKRLPFEAIVRRTVAQRFEVNFRRAFEYAMRTAK